MPKATFTTEYDNSEPKNQPDLSQVEQAVHLLIKQVIEASGSKSIIQIDFEFEITND